MYPKPIDLWTVLGAGFIGAGFWSAIQAERKRAVAEWRRQQERQRAIEQCAWNNMLKHCPPTIPACLGRSFSAN